MDDIIYGIDEEFVYQVVAKRKAFESWYAKNRRRFYTCQFDTDEIAYAAYLAGYDEAVSVLEKER